MKKVIQKIPQNVLKNKFKTPPKSLNINSQVTLDQN